MSDLFNTESKLCAFAKAQATEDLENLTQKAKAVATAKEQRLLRVTCGILRRGRSFFCARRGAMLGMAGKWEFPGGKIEEGETASACVIREIKEELGVLAVVEEYLGMAVYTYPSFVIELHVFVLKEENGISEPKLSEHTEGAWRTADELLTLPWDECDSLFVPLLRTYNN